MPLKGSDLAFCILASLRSVTGLACSMYSIHKVTKYLIPQTGLLLVVKEDAINNYARIKGIDQHHSGKPRSRVAPPINLG